MSVTLYVTLGATESTKMVHTSRTPVMTMSSALIVVLMNRYLSALMDTSLSLLEVHKAMYFMQESGQPLRLRFSKAPYGPYAENLRHVLSAVEGHFIIGYGDGGDAPNKPLMPKVEMIEMAEKMAGSDTSVAERVDRVSDLITRFATPYGMELASTVHWVARHENASTVQEAVHAVYDWNERKRMFAEAHIHRTWDTLHCQGWL